LAGHGNLEEQSAHDDTVTHHHPAFPGRVLPMLHSVQQLVLVDEMTDHKICKTGK
jgi:hypothetical protein